MTSNRLELGDVVELEDRRWVFVGMDGTRAVILQAAGEPHTDDNRMILSLPAFHEAVGSSVRPAEFAVRPVDGNWPDDVVEMGKHLQETIDGTPKSIKTSIAGGPRLEYDPKTTKARDRVAAKAAELAGTSLATSERSLWRLRATYAEGGLASLAERMHPATAQTLATAHVNPDVLAIIDEVLREQTNAPTANRKKAITQIRRRASRAEIEIDVTDRTLRRWIAERVAGRHTFGKATTRRTAANSPEREFRTALVLRPGQQVEIDSTPFDLLCRGTDGKPFRPTLTLMWDTATAIPLAWAFHPVANKGFDHAVLLASAIVGRKAVPGQEATRLAASAVLPHEVMRAINTWLDDDNLALPYIWPEEITADGGMDFRSTVFAGACLAYGISLNLAAPGSPTDKPHVERAFRTIREGFTQYLAGYTGGDVSNRGKLDDPVWTMEALDLLFAMWVSTVYLNTPSDALRDPSRPDLTWTPNQWYAALFRVSAGLPIPFSAEDYIALMPAEKRTIQADGIHIDNRVYDSRGLNGLRKLRSNSADGKWEVRQHPYNPAAVWLRHPETREWIECVDKSLNWVNTPFLTVATAHRPNAQTHENRPDAAHEAFVDHIELYEMNARREAARTHRAKNIPQPKVAIPSGPQVVVPDDASGLDVDTPVFDLGLIDPEEI